VINNTNANYQAAIAAIQALGATTVVIPPPSPAQNFPDILASEFKRDLNAYLSRLPATAPMKSLTDIIAFNSAHADEALKFGQTQLTASNAINLSDPATNAAYVANRDGGRAATRAAIDDALTANHLEAIMTPSGTLTGTGARAGYPQIVVPAGYNAADRRPIGIAFNGTAYSEERLLGFADAYEQATKLRKPVSEINPAVWRCYSGNPRSCSPGKEVATGVTLDFPLETATFSDLQARMTAGTLTATQLTKAYLQRIALTNAEGPSINAVRSLNPRALDEAAQMDAQRAAGHVRGPLHPRDRQGQPRRRGHPDHRRLGGAGEQRPGQGFPGRGEAARGGRDPARQGEPVRVRQLPHHRHAERLFEPRRPGAEPVRRGHHAVGLELRLGRGGGRRPGGHHDRH
jgi:hypothetical protein